MIVQMRDECCPNASSLDLDRVLRELQDRTSGDDFSSIGPFGILHPNSSSRPINLPEAEDTQDVELVPRITTPEINLSLSQFAWGDMDNLATWDTLETESATALINMRFTPDKDLYIADSPSQWMITRPPSVAQMDLQMNAEEVESELVQILAKSKGKPICFVI